jgi:dTDP-4-dehydrorhamnose reductase
LGKSKVVIFGGSGMLGRSLLEQAPEGVELYSIGRSKPQVDVPVHFIKADILNFSELDQVLKTVNPNVILNAAACVQVDSCESNQDEVRKLHVDLPAFLSKAANNLKALHVYISTDAIFDGQKIGAYVETDQTNPLNHYALTKLQGEKATLDSERSLVLRVNILGWRSDGKLSFGQWTLDGLQNQKPLTMFKDVFFTPLSTIDLAKKAWRAIALNVTGLFHVGGGEAISKYEFAVRLAERLKLSSQSLVPIEVEDKGLIAKRPKNLCMNSTKFEKAVDQSMPTFSETMETWLIEGKKLGKIEI